ncbi:hypothetical protein AVEN_185469-1 [Araneus ventricosus]|uniref:Uncharacterized protein n=1 Tax=Araneus ventricosus TaxID=182803 RepID=A0A4Y2HDL5_ARAVE|nr:hypothetical protein AVEN_185469-1 [Araneus ventricosus]
MTSTYVIKGRLPPINLHFREKSKEFFSTVHSPMGENLQIVPQPTTTGQIQWRSDQGVRGIDASGASLRGRRGDETLLSSASRRHVTMTMAPNALGIAKVRGSAKLGSRETANLRESSILHLARLNGTQLL